MPPDWNGSDVVPVLISVLQWVTIGYWVQFQVSEHATHWLLGPAAPGTFADRYQHEVIDLVAIVAAAFEFLSLIVAYG